MTTNPAPTAAKPQRGRPAVGPDVKYRLSPELRRQLADAMRPGESEAAAVRRLLAVALNPLTTAALLYLAALNTDLAAESCISCDALDGELCPGHQRAADTAAALGQLADDAAPADVAGHASDLATHLAGILTPTADDGQAGGTSRSPSARVGPEGGPGHHQRTGTRAPGRTGPAPVQHRTPRATSANSPAGPLDRSPAEARLTGQFAVFSTEYNAADPPEMTP